MCLSVTKLTASYLIAYIACARVKVTVVSCVQAICYHASCYIPGLYIENKVPLDFLRHFQDINCVDFIENALFESVGDIC